MTAQHPRQPPKKERPRSCRDRWKHQRHQHRRRRATADPATRVFLELLVLVLAILGRAPVNPLAGPAAAPAARPRPAVRDDRSPDAIERERGEGGYLMPPRRDARRYGRYKSTPTYRRLVRDLQRPAARKEALDVLKKRLDLPPEARGWLDGLEKEDELAALLPFVRPGLTDTDSEAELLLAAVQWLEARTDPERPSPPPVPPDDDGRGGKGRGAKPPPDDDDDDGPPPPGKTKP